MYIFFVSFIRFKPCKVSFDNDLWRTAYLSYDKSVKSRGKNLFMSKVLKVI